MTPPGAAVALVARASAGPTAIRQANCTFSGDSGAGLTSPATNVCRNDWMGSTESIGERQVYHSNVRLVLASASPRRQELLTAAGYVFEIDPAATDESVRPGEDATAYALRVAFDKARVVRARRQGAIILAADTIVVVDGDILGKPRDRAEAAAMLERLSDRTHEVLTAVVVSGGHEEVSHVERTQVRFAPLTRAEIAWYVASDEPLDKAGAYAVQGLAGRFVTEVSGSYSNVVGLPVSVVYKLLRIIGFDDVPPSPDRIDPAAGRGYSGGVSRDSFTS